MKLIHFKYSFQLKQMAPNKEIKTCCQETMKNTDVSVKNKEKRHLKTSETFGTAKDFVKRKTDISEPIAIRNNILHQFSYETSW